MWSIGVVSEDSDICKRIRAAVPHDCHVEWYPRGEGLESRCLPSMPQVLLVDISILRGLQSSGRGGSWDRLLRLRNEGKPAQLIILTPKGQIHEAVKMAGGGGVTYLTYPVQPAKLKSLLNAVQAALAAGAEGPARDTFWKATFKHLIQTNSPKMRGVLDQVKAVAPTDATVLLCGETGTGKNMLAKLIHEHSARADKPLVAVHCGAIPEGLVESEFFGHEKGAFTGAVRKKMGKFEIANQGTIFLDEIGTITLPVQIKLLQVLQEGTFSRVGGERPLQTDVRVISASNVELKRLVEQGSFRQDLYYRLEVFPIHLPPLRERREDIPLLARTLLDKLNRRHRKPIRDLHPDVINAFLAYDWPGNIREMENVMERAYILETESSLTPTHFPTEIMGSVREMMRPLFSQSMTLAEFRKHAVEEAERTYLSELLRLHRGRVNLTAQSAGITPRQLHKLMKRHRLKKEDYRPVCNGPPQNGPSSGP